MNFVSKLLSRIASVSLLSRSLILLQEMKRVLPIYTFRTARMQRKDTGTGLREDRFVLLGEGRDGCGAGIPGFLFSLGLCILLLTRLLPDKVRQ
jgi:hypothetical protein